MPPEQDLMPCPESARLLLAFLFARLCRRGPLCISTYGLKGVSSPSSSTSASLILEDEFLASGVTGIKGSGVDNSSGFSCAEKVPSSPDNDVQVSVVVRTIVLSFPCSDGQCVWCRLGLSPENTGDHGTTGEPKRLISREVTSEARPDPLLTL